MTRHDPDVLAQLLGAKNAEAPPNGHRAGSVSFDTSAEPVDLADYPEVQAALDNPVPKDDGTVDRSTTIYKVLGAAIDAGLQSAQAFAVVCSQADLAQKVDEGGGVDLTRSWIKLIDERQRRRDRIPAERPPGHQPDTDEDEPLPVAQADEDEPTTWEPLDLGLYLRGEITHPQPTVGLARMDGLRLIYPGREHAILGETESGKTWVALGCVAAELIRGNRVLYIHYEESGAESTIERLRLLGVADDVIESLFQFVAPMRAVRGDWLTALLDPPPALVVHDGVNEGMSLHGADIMAAEGASTFRRNLIVPCTRTGAATLACDHLPLIRDGARRDAYGSVHKGNALDGARILLENVEPFGRGMRGMSNVFVTKDRPGYLRARGRPTKTPGRTFMGALVVDDSKTSEPFEMPFYAPRVGPEDDDNPTGMTVNSAELADIVHGVVMALPDHSVPSLRRLCAEMRSAGQCFREGAIRNAADDLVVTGRLIEVPGKRGATGYRAPSTAARESAQ